MPKAKKPKLTVKEQKLVKGIAQGKSQTQAAKDAGYSERSAAELASKTLKKVNVQEALYTALRKHNITPDRTVQRVSEAMDAEKVAIVGNGEQAMAEITPDHTTRLAAVKIANTLMGLGQKQETGTTQNFIQVNNNYKDRYAD